jgi:hypothetical protein
MPVFKITAPDGTVYRVTGPEGSTEAQALEQVKASLKQPEKSGGVLQQAGNLAAGAVRGAGSIGATLLAPIDVAKDAIAGKGLSLESNRQRRADMDAALQSMGADTDSLAYGAGKLGTEIAGTLGVGGTLARGAAAIPGVAAKAPGVVNAIRTAGMQGGTGTAMQNAFARAVGGGVTGGASAALVNPEDAGTGAAIGAVAPGITQVAGKIGNAIGSTIRGPAQTPELASAIQAARDAGYVIPPTQAKPSLGNRVLEGLSGKITTAQNASAKNQAVTNAKAAAAVGLPTDQPITADALQAVRRSAGQAYDSIGQTGSVTPGKAYDQALDAIAAPYLKAAQGFPDAPPSPVLKLVDSLRSTAFDAAAAVEKVKHLRTAADDAFRTGNTDIGRAAKKASQALEDALEAHLQSVGNPQALQAFKDARQLIAKTYTVEKALNPTTGTVDARKLGQQITKGKPLSGELKAAGDFANRFPKAAQASEGMGSLPQTSPLDWAMGGGLAMGTGNPLMLASMAARPTARAAILSPMVQNRLVQQGPTRNALAALLGRDAAQLGYRAAPVVAADW